MVAVIAVSWKISFILLYLILCFNFTWTDLFIEFLLLSWMVLLFFSSSVCFLFLVVILKRHSFSFTSQHKFVLFIDFAFLCFQFPNHLIKILTQSLNFKKWCVISVKKGKDMHTTVFLSMETEKKLNGKYSQWLQMRETAPEKNYLRGCSPNSNGVWHYIIDQSFIEAVGDMSSNIPIWPLSPW